MKWKIFNSGQYTELKLIWCPKHANKMGHTARNSSYHKAPSAVRRDQDRQQQYVAKCEQQKEQQISVKDTIDIITQSENKRVTRNRSRNFQSIEQPSSDINAQSEMYVLDSPIVPNLAMSASTVQSPMSFISMVSKPDLAGESTPMAIYDISPTKCDISPISDTSTTEQACTIAQDMSVDKQIPVEVPVSADS